MPILDVFNVKNEKIETISLSEKIFCREISLRLLSEVVHWQRSKRRSGTQSALTKAEVSGTTKKPFPQKGRGVARQGSYKNPHQIGGGVAFAPKTRDHSYGMPKSKRRSALAVALSVRQKESSLRVLDSFDVGTVKAKKALTMLKNINSNKTLVIDCDNENLKLSLRNLSFAKYLDIKGINVYDILQFPKLIITKKAIIRLEKKILGLKDE